MVPVVSEGVSPAPPYSGYLYVCSMYFYRAITCYGHFSQSVRINEVSKKRSYNPITAVTEMVWAVPLSLATTCGITIVFSSCRYLDVSVLCVCFQPFGWITSLQLVGLPHSDIYGSKFLCNSP
jgi:hypothetical protein